MGKRAGYSAQTGKHLLSTQNVSERTQQLFLCPQQIMLRAGANRETFVFVSRCKTLGFVRKRDGLKKSPLHSIVLRACENYHRHFTHYFSLLFREFCRVTNFLRFLLRPAKKIHATTFSAAHIRKTKAMKPRDNAVLPIHVYTFFYITLCLVFGRG